MGVCDYPVRLANDGGGVRSVRCGATDAAMCATCADLHAGDVRQLVAEGLDALGDGPATFITLTAPGRELGGPVHSQRLRRGQSRPCGCGQTHAADDPLLGTPLDWSDFDYAAVVAWNAACRRLVTITLQKLWRLVTNGRALPYVCVPERQARGALHWHIIIGGHVPAAAVRLAVAGGVNPATRRPIRPASHGGLHLGERVDVQAVVTRDGRGRVARYVSKYVSKSVASTVAPSESVPMMVHRKKIARAARMVVGECAQSTVEDGARPRRRLATGCVRPHAQLPGSITERFAPGHADHCPRRRRAARFAGHTGHTMTRGRRWPVRMLDLHARRCGWNAANAAKDDSGDGGLVRLDDGRTVDTATGEVRGRWAYAGRGHGSGITTMDVEAAVRQRERERV